MELRWSDRASAELDAIFAYIAADKESAAMKQIRLILATIHQLETFPKSGRPINLGKTRVLAISGTPYVVHYRIHKDAIKLMAIVHGAMNKPRRT